MFEHSQSVVDRERLAPVVERGQGRSNLAPVASERVARFKRALPDLGPHHKAGTYQIPQRGAEHLLGDSGNLATELGETARAVANRCENDRAPASAERSQGDVDATHVKPVTHELPP